MKQQFVVVAVALGFMACGQAQKDGSGKPGADPAAPNAGGSSKTSRVVVARIGKREITLADLEARLRAQKEHVRMRFGSVERKKAFLEKLVRFEVLAAEAERRKLDRHPEVVRLVKQAMVSQLVRDLNRDLVKFSDITEADIRARYKRDIAKHQRAAQPRVAQLVVGSLAAAKKYRAELKTKSKDARHFVKLVMAHSVDKASKARHGDLGFIDAKTSKLPAPLVKAALALSEPWQLSEPIKIGSNYHILLRTGYRPPLNRSLELVRDRIRNQLFHERRYEAVRVFVDGLRKKAKVVIDEAVLAKARGTQPRPKLKLPPSQREATEGK